MSAFTVESGKFLTWATEAKSKYLDSQSALWLILTEQGQKTTLKDMDSEVIKMIPRNEWLVARKNAQVLIDAIRGDDVSSKDQVPLIVRSQLQRYVNEERYWLAASEILAEEAATNLDFYFKHITCVVELESFRSTPYQIKIKLDERKLPTSLSDIETHLIAEGLMVKRPESVSVGDNVNSDAHCGQQRVTPCRLLKKLVRRMTRKTESSIQTRSTDQDLRTIRTGSFL